MDTAVVLGGSVAGLLAARVLSDYATSVIIVERDDPRISAEPRPGVPQGAQVHLLLPGGLIQIERWFPGFTEQAVAAGARPVPPAMRRFYVDGVPLGHRGSQTTTLSATRPFFEAQIRRHTLALPNVKTITARATGLDFSVYAVTGVRYESDGESGHQGADFIVDAMGRSSRLAQWLVQAGWQYPSLQRMKVQINYATALFRRLDTDPDFGAAFWRPLDLSSGVKGAVMSQVEGDRWTMLMSGYVDNRPGHDEDDFMRVCKTVLPPEFGAVAERGRLTAEIVTFRHTENVRRDFCDLTRMPARLIATGDAVASFNPVYGQGMTAAALHASALSEYLRTDPDLSEPARDFFELQQVVVDAAWDASASMDVALPHVDAPYPRGYRLRHWIWEQVRAATVHDQKIARRFEEVGYMLRHPSSLRTPRTVARAVLVNLWAKRRR